MGTPVTLRFRHLPQRRNRGDGPGMEHQRIGPDALSDGVVATTDDPPYGYDYWQTTLPAQEQTTILYYRYIVRDGSDEDFYEDDSLLTAHGEPRTTTRPTTASRLTSINRISRPRVDEERGRLSDLPDRFHNGNLRTTRDHGPDCLRQSGTQEVLDRSAGGYCRAYVDIACDEDPYGRDFFGGDLQGVINKLDYLPEPGCHSHLL